MTDKKDGDPGAVRHLRPKNMPHHTEVNVPGGPPGDSAREFLLDGEEGLIEEITGQLEKLRAPFPPEEIEKLPKPMFKGAWDGESKGRCEICGGYHVLVNTIHLDYVGHAGVTRRLLEVDPMWNWKPFARDEHGQPLFDRFGGLWIKLTICGVTRLGYGDAAGKDPGTTAVKEIIGDAIRNAAMRFGVALELWSKIDRHEGKNPGATDDTRSRQTSSGGSTGGRGNSSRRGGKQDQASGSNAPRAANQDALDKLLSICNQHGYDTRQVEDRFNRDYGPLEGELVSATPEAIRTYGQLLVTEATAEPDTGEAEVGDGAGPEGEAGGGAEAILADDTTGDEAQSDPYDGAAEPPAATGPMF